MILGPDGKPVRINTGGLTPHAWMHELKQRLTLSTTFDRSTEIQIADLRRSCGAETIGVGQTITVRVPRQFQPPETIE